MSVSHNAVRETTRASAMDRLLAYIEARRSATEMIEDWEVYEEELHRLFMEAECEMMAEELTRLDVEAPFVVIDGKVHYRVLRSESTYEGVAGAIRVERTLYRESGVSSMPWYRWSCERGLSRGTGRRWRANTWCGLRRT